MKASGETRKKEESIAALLTQQSIEEAPRVAGIGANTLLRWLKVRLRPRAPAQRKFCASGNGDAWHRLGESKRCHARQDDGRLR